MVTSIWQLYVLSHYSRFQIRCNISAHQFGVRGERGDIAFSRDFIRFSLIFIDQSKIPLIRRNRCCIKCGTDCKNDIV